MQFAKMLLLSTGLGAVAGLFGMYVSYYVTVPPGAAIVLILAGVFVVVFAASALTARRRLRSLEGVDAHTDVTGPAVEAG